MASEMKGIRCKCYTLPGMSGGELIISETIDRQSIAVSIRVRGEALDDITQRKNNWSHTVHLTGEQFAALCRMDSLYDGLEVDKPGQQLELVEEESAQEPIPEDNTQVGE